MPPEVQSPYYRATPWRARGGTQNPIKNGLKKRWSKNALWSPMGDPSAAFWAILGPKGSQNEAPGVTFEGHFWYFLGVRLKN